MFRNLVFEGGGVKGIAYVGAIEVLHEEDVMTDIRRVGGTSAGAINAVLISLGYKPDDLFSILYDLDFKNFMDDSWGVTRDLNRLTTDFGWYKGDFFHSWISDHIAKKVGNPRATFRDLKDRGCLDLHLCGTNLSTGYSEVFSCEHTPRTRVADAVRISMSIPLFFKAIRAQSGDVYVDGGVLRNYPIKLFDREKYIDPKEQKKAIRRPDYYRSHNNKLKELGRRLSPYVYNKQTMGFRLASESETAMFRDGAEPPHHKINDLFDYAWAIVSTFTEFQNNLHLHSDDWQRTVYIDTKGVQTTDFDLSDAKKTELVESGRDGMSAYLSWFRKGTTINHPDYVEET